MAQALTGDAAAAGDAIVAGPSPEDLAFLAANQEFAKKADKALDPARRIRRARREAELLRDRTAPEFSPIKGDTVTDAQYNERAQYKAVRERDRKRCEELLETCRKDLAELKRNIGCVMQRPDLGIEEIKGRNLENGLPKTVKLSSNELIEAFVEPMNHILDAIHAVLERTPPQLVGDLDKNGIILSGGGSLIYGIDRLIERSTGIRCAVVDDPISCAAYGAGKMLRNLDNMQDGMMNFYRMRQLKG